MQLAIALMFSVSSHVIAACMFSVICSKITLEFCCGCITLARGWEDLPNFRHSYATNSPNFSAVKVFFHTAFDSRINHFMADLFPTINPFFTTQCSLACETMVHVVLE